MWNGRGTAAARGRTRRSVEVSCPTAVNPAWALCPNGCSSLLNVGLWQEAALQAGCTCGAGRAGTLVSAHLPPVYKTAICCSFLLQACRWDEMIPQHSGGCMCSLPSKAHNGKMET